MERRASAGEAVISTTTSKRTPRCLVAGPTKPPAIVATARTNALRMTESALAGSAPRLLFGVEGGNTRMSRASTLLECFLNTHMHARSRKHTAG